mgnify:CR=1 FL=1
MARTAHDRGVALMLVLLATAVAVILALSFQAAQSTTLPISQNISQHASARAVAESALAMAATHVRTSDSWRDDFANGQLPVDSPFAEGSFTLSVEDGQDLNHDGVISVPDEGDGDLTDDASDPVTLTVIGRVGNVTHTVSAVVQPASSEIKVTMLYLLQSGTPVGYEADRIAMFEGWGYTVVTLASTSSKAAIDQAIADHGIQVVYISTFVQGTVAGKVDHITLGVVNEESQAYPYLGLATDGDDSPASEIDITDNTHYITSPFAAGPLTIATQAIDAQYPTGTLAPSLRVLGEHVGSSRVTLAVLERGDTTCTGGRVPGRRVMLPWSGSQSHFHPTADGKTLIRRAVEWAAADAPSIAGLWAEWHDVSYGLSSLSGIDWDATPTHTSIEAQANWASTGGSLYSGGPSETFGVKLTGRITIPTDGAWTFYTNSDDGSDLWINGSRIVDNDGLHAMRERSGTVTLTAGEHDIMMRCFEHGGGVGLIASWAGPGVSKQVIPGSVLTVGPSDGDDEEDTVKPQLVALYSFATPTPVNPNLVAHWRLDESGGGGGVSAGGRIRVDDEAIIDSYSSAAGAYGGANVGSNAQVSTNMTTGAKLHIKGDAQVRGHAWCGAGGNPNNVIQVNNGSTLTGTRGALAADITFPNYNAPSGMPSSLGSRTYTTAQTWNSDRKFDDLTLSGSSCVVTVTAHVRVDVTKKFTMSNSARININSGASLTLYCNEGIVIDNDATINDDSTATSRLTMLTYGSSAEIEIKNRAVVAGLILGESDVLIDDDAVVYGSVRTAGKMTIKNDSAFHQDLSLPGFGLPFAVYDSTADRDGTASNGPATGQSGAHASTATAIAFDGSNDYVAVPHDSDFLLDHGTLSFWFRTSNTAKFQGLVTKDTLNFATGGHLCVFVDGGRVAARIQSTSNSYWNYSSPISSNTWHHVAVTWGAGGWKLYLNGSLADSDSYDGGLGTSSGGSGNFEPWAFGSNTWKSSQGDVTPLQDYLVGVLDDIRLYDSALAEDQIADLAAGSDPGPAYPPTVYDTSGFGTPLDLTIAHPDRVTWLPANAGLQIDAATLITSGGAATKIHSALTDSDQLTIEAVFTPANLTQNGPARIATLSPDPYNCNAMIGQNASGHLGRLRTNTTGSNGTPDIAASGLTLARQHVILTYDGENVSLYRNGVLETQTPRTGNLDAWNAAYALILANEPSADRPWLGTLHRVAVWDRGMNGLQIKNLFQGKDPGDGVSNLTFSVRWME